MDKYIREADVKLEDPNHQATANEIRVTTAGKMRAFITYASKKLQDNTTESITLKAMGRAIHKTVLIAEIIKRRFPNLHQVTQIDSTLIPETYYPKEEGLEPVKTTRNVSSILITLYTKGPDPNTIGYQAPLSETQIPSAGSGAPSAAPQNRSNNNNPRPNRGPRNRRGRGGRNRGPGGPGGPLNKGPNNNPNNNNPNPPNPNEGPANKDITPTAPSNAPPANPGADRPQRIQEGGNRRFSSSGNPRGSGSGGPLPGGDNSGRRGGGMRGSRGRGRGIGRGSRGRGRGRGGRGRFPKTDAPPPSTTQT